MTDSVTVISILDEQHIRPVNRTRRTLDADT